MKKKNILVLCPKGDLNSGGVISNFQLIKYLRDKGHTLRVITSWTGTYNTELDKENISNRTIPYNWWTERDDPKSISERSLSAVSEIITEIESFNADVVITNTSHIPWGAFAASMTNTPHIWIIREFPINSFGYLLKKIKFMSQYSNKLMANSGELSGYYNKELGCDVGKFMSYVDVSTISLGKSTASPRLVSPNTINSAKNQMDLVNAVGILVNKRTDLDIKVLLMGEKDKEYWPSLRQRIIELGLLDNFEIKDRVANPWGLVAPNDIMVQTSLSESIGRTTTEAMKLGIPVIASDIPGHREAFSLGGGTLYKLGDAQDLAIQIESILDNPKKAALDARRVQARALKNMSADASSGVFAELIEKIADEPNPMGVNIAMKPYFQQIIDDLHDYKKIIEKKNRDTDELTSIINELRESTAYKVGRLQADAIKRIVRIFKRGKKI